MESGSGLGELSFWYTDYLPLNQQFAFSGLLIAVDRRGSSSYKFDYILRFCPDEVIANPLKTGALAQPPGNPNHLILDQVLDSQSAEPVVAEASRRTPPCRERKTEMTQPSRCRRHANIGNHSEKRAWQVRLQVIDSADA